MKLALAQYALSTDPDRNMRIYGEMILRAKTEAADIVLFPELSLSPYFPKADGADIAEWTAKAGSTVYRDLSSLCRQFSIWACTTLCAEEDGHRYEVSLLITDRGEIAGRTYLRHVLQGPGFFGPDYFEPGPETAPVTETPFGRVGIVVGADRHVPERIRTCAEHGAQLILVPATNPEDGPLELHEWEVRTQAYQTGSFLALCSRIGEEDGTCYAGQSLFVRPDGSVIEKTADDERLPAPELTLAEADLERRIRPWLAP